MGIEPMYSARQADIIDHYMNEPYSLAERTGFEPAHRFRSLSFQDWGLTIRPPLRLNTLSNVYSYTCYDWNSTNASERAHRTACFAANTL